MSVVACGCVLAGWALSPPLGEPWIVAVNRVISIFSVAVVGGLCHRLLKQLRRLERSREELQTETDRIVGLREEDSRRNRAMANIIDDNRRQQDSLRENARFRDALLNVIPTSVYIYDLVDHTYQWASTPIFRRLGYSDDEAERLGDRAVDRLMNPEDRDTLARHWRDVAELPDGLSREVEFRLRHAGGIDAWFLARDTVFRRDPSGRATQIAGAAYDVTKLKESVRQMWEAKEAAERANRVRGEFLANVSHELRTPMNAIIGMTQLCLDEDLPEEAHGYVRTANESAHSLLALLNDILDFSKLESGKFRIDPEPMSVRGLLEDTITSLAPAADAKRLELVCDVAPDCYDGVSADRVRLRQVLANLISNAIKFTDHGEVFVEVTSLWTGDDETRLRFSVRDTGTGIPESERERILQPFTQVDESSTRRHGGTGLGLAICSELLNLMGGRLEIDSELNVGSRFRFDLTLPIAPEIQPAAVDSVDALDSVPVLVVDDNETNLRIIAKILRKWNMRVETVTSGTDALARIENVRRGGQRFDLVIVDALMPRMDGYTLAEQIARRSPSDAPIVLMASSADRQSYRDREQRASLAAFLRKPVVESELRDALIRALRANAAASSPSPEPTPAEAPSVGSINGSSSANAADAAPPNARSAGGSTESSPPARRSLRILVAEDTRPNQVLIRKILEREGHEVTMTGNGREAVETFRTDRFDLILMDVQMPLMDGFQATETIRRGQRSTGRHVPIVAMTAHVMKGDRERCLESGMDAYVAKPIDVATLLRLIENVTADGNAAPPEPDPADPPADNVVDIDAMRSRLGDDALIVTVLEMLIKESETMVDRIERAAEDGDLEAFTRNSHSLKGVVASVGGASTVARLQAWMKAADIDAASRYAEDVPTLRADLASLTAEAEDFRRELDDATPPSPPTGHSPPID